MATARPGPAVASPAAAGAAPGGSRAAHWVSVSRGAPLAVAGVSASPAAPLAAGRSGAFCASVPNFSAVWRAGAPLGNLKAPHRAPPGFAVDADDTATMTAERLATAPDVAAAGMPLDGRLGDRLADQPPWSRATSRCSQPPR